MTRNLSVYWSGFIYIGDGLGRSKLAVLSQVRDYRPVGVNIMTYSLCKHTDHWAIPNELPVSRTDQAEIVTWVAGIKIQIINESH